jgi:hypothetical protein
MKDSFSKVLWLVFFNVPIASIAFSTNCSSERPSVEMFGISILLSSPVAYLSTTGWS